MEGERGGVHGRKERRGRCAWEKREEVCMGGKGWRRKGDRRSHRCTHNYGIIHPTSVTEKREGVIHLYMYQYRGRGGVETQGAYSLERGRVHINHLDRWRATKSKSFCEGREHSSLPLDCT